MPSPARAARRIAFATACLLLWGAARPTIATTTWDVTAAFSTVNNPSGDWAFGWKPSLTGAFTPYTTKTTIQGGTSTKWYAPSDASIWRNDSAYGAYGVAPGWVSIHPGTAQQPSVARWTSPVAGIVAIHGLFGAGDSAALDAYIYHGGTEVWSRMDFTSNVAFSLTRAVAVGDTIDWLVTGGYGSGSTPLMVVITQGSPAAGTWDVAAQYGRTTNPSGAWSYGWKATLTGAMNLFADKREELGGTTTTWYSPSNTAALWRNGSASTAYGVPPGWVSIHPGSSGQPCVARWTSPIAGDVFLSGIFGAGDSGTLDAYIVHDGEVAWSRMRFNTDVAFGLHRTVDVGDTIDWQVAGGYYYGNTPIMVIITPNATPAADAGPDQTVRPGTLVTLDGSGSTDPDGDRLTHQWTIAAKPAGSTAALSSATAVRPTFTADLPGNYEIRLVVTDTTGTSSPPDVVVISTTNSAPVAVAGGAQTVRPGALVTLDGSGSHDTDGDPIAFAWSLAALPDGSLAEPSDATAIGPTFTPDLPGDYEARLVVTDCFGSASDAASVVVSTVNSAPVADAGSARAAHQGSTVTLDGSGSHDADGDPLTWSWSLTAKPAGSAAELARPTSPAPTFTLDLAGDYVAQLVVTDNFRAASAPATVLISSNNLPPTADAGTQQTAHQGSLVTLNGSASSDPDGDAITHAWAIVAQPASSLAVLSDPASPSPTFTVDVSGEYVLQLIVTDALGLASEPVTVVVAGTNSAPVAEAGAGQTIHAGLPVTLDGSSSNDPDGDALTYAWAFSFAPTGSQAILDDATGASPTFVPDVAGDYVLSLVVTDAFGLASDPDSVLVSGVNSAPVAAAGPDQAARPGVVVTLDGSGSSDPDGDAVSYSWALTSVPDGSAATLSDAAHPNPTFLLDVAGEYAAQLVVQDAFGLRSEPDTVAISCTNAAPVAEAGGDQAVTLVGSTVALDGTQSYDPDGDDVSFAWSFASRPPGSAATLQGATEANAAFAPDVHGDYVVQLVVADPWTSSVPDTARVSFANLRPVADAGASGSAVVGDPVTLDGSGSSDPNGDALAWAWAFASRPGGSQAALQPPFGPTSGFVPDVAGTYVVELVVTDGELTSLPSLVQVQAVVVVDSAIEAVEDCQETVAAMSPWSLKNGNMGKALLNKLNAVIARVEAGELETALNQLENDVLGKTDGCAATGQPDANDWVRTCAAQAELRQEVLIAIDRIEALR